MARSDRFKLEINEVLQDVSRAELEQFLSRYTKKNQDLYYTLLTHFARHTDSGQNEKKFEYLFYRILRSYLPSGSKPLKKRIRTVVSLFKVLLSHARDALALESYRETFQILRPGLVFTKLLWKRSDKIDESVHELFVEFHRYLGKLINRPIPPPLKDEILSFCMEHSLVYDYTAPSDRFNLFGLCARLIEEKEVASNYARSLMEAISERQSSWSGIQLVKSHLFEILMDWRLNDIRRQVLAERIIRPEDFAGIVQFLKDRDKSKEAMEAIDTFIPHSVLDGAIVMSYLQIELLLDSGTSHQKVLHSISKLAELERSLKPLLQFVPTLKLSGKAKADLLDGIEKSPILMSARDDKIRLALLLGEEKTAYRWLVDIKEPEPLIRHMGSFRLDYKEKVMDALIRLLLDELSASYGSAGVSRVEEILRKMNNGKLEEEKAILRDAIRKAFPGRKSLRIMSF